MVPVKNLGELRWYGGCHFTREREMGALTISQKTFADESVKTNLCDFHAECSTASWCKTKRIQ